MSNPTETQSPVEKLKARSVELEAMIGVRRLELQAKALGVSGRMLESVDDFASNYVDPREWMTDDFGPSFWGGGLTSSRQDRDEGDDKPFFSNENDLAAIRGRSRWIAGANGLGNGILEKLTDYVIGTGFVFKFQPKNPVAPAPVQQPAPIPTATPTATPQPGASGERQGSVAGADGEQPVSTGVAPGEQLPPQQPPAPVEEPKDPLATLCQEIWDRFAEENDWQGDLDREIFTRVRRDGEALVLVYPGEAGSSIIRLAEPDNLTEPHGPQDLERAYGIDHLPGDWKYGIHTAADDVCQIYGYHFQWSENSADFDYLPVEMVEHIKVNVDRTVKRGLSDFYPVLQRLETSEKLLRNTEAGAAVQAAIAYIRESAEGTGKSAAENAQFSRVDFTHPSGMPSGRQVNVKKFEPGTVITVPNGQKYHPGPLGSERGQDFIFILQASMRWIGNRWSMPEFLISGDASNANMASTMVAESPWVKSCQAKQHFMKRRFANIVWRVIGNAVRAGMFDAHGIWSMDAKAVEQIKKLVVLDIEAPQIEVRDKAAETDRRAVLHEKKILSAKTWTSQEGEDWETEQRQLATEPKPAPTVMLGPDGMPMPQGPPNGPPGANGERRDGGGQFDNKPTQESVNERLARAVDFLWEGYPG